MKKTTDPKAAPKRRRTFSQLLALEQRMLFDAAAFATVDAVEHPQDTAHNNAHEGGDHAHDTSAHEASHERSASASGNAGGGMFARAPAYNADRGSDSSADRTAVPEVDKTAALAGGSSYLFVDSSVSNWQSIAAAADANTTVIQLDGSKDALTQIAEALESADGKVSSVHIVSHGDSGALELSGKTIDNTALQSSSEVLARIGNTLTVDADILLYGCDVAEGSNGANFLNALATATGADVEASTDLTGSADKGGDWDLEAKTGSIETTSIVAKDYDGVLCDNPVAVKDSAIVAEDATRSVDATGGVLANDSDPNGDHLHVSGISYGAGTTPLAGQVDQQVQGTYGTLTLHADGSYSYSATTDRANALGAGEYGRDVFTYEVSDGKGGTAIATLTLRVNGTNDAPVAARDSNSVLENQSVSGDVIKGDNGNPCCIKGLDHDPDGDPLTISGVASGTGTPDVTKVGQPITVTYGTLTLNKDGTYTFDANTPQADALREGQVVQEVFTYQVSDGAGGTASTTLTITITGTNDAPIATDDTGHAVEASPGDAGSDAKGNVLTNDTDVDNGDTKTVSAVRTGTETGTGTDGTVGTGLKGLYGTLTLNADGSYTYVVDNNNPTVNALNQGETLQEKFTYTMKDGSGATDSAQLTITIEGRNDVTNHAPVAADDAGTAKEAGGVNNGTAGNDATGNVLGNDTDSDTGDTKTVTGIRTGTETGTGTDGTVGTALQGQYGTLTLNADGSYTYVVDNSKAAVQALNPGQTLSETFTYTMKDGAGAADKAQLTITINGANDAPVAVKDTGRVVEDQTLTVGKDTGVLSNDTDVDGASRIVTGVATGNGTPKETNVGTAITGTYGTLTLNPDGSYTYKADTARANALGQDEFGRDVFTYQVSDGQGGVAIATLTITVQGTNDAPVAKPDTNCVLENGKTGGNVLDGDNSDPNCVKGMDTDPDGDPLTVTGVAVDNGTPDGNLVGKPITTTYGILTLNADGSYTFDANTPQADALKAGERVQQVFTYQISDGQGGTATTTLTICITGTNDSPVATNDSGTAKEAGGVNNGTPGSDATGNVLGNDTDVDAGDSKTVSGIRTGEESGTGTAGTVGTELKGLYGTLTLNADGTYTYVVDNNNATVQALNPSETLQEKFTYTVKDGSGATDTAQLTITVQGANDAPTATNDGTTAVEDSGQDVKGNVLPNDTDPDHNDTKTVTGIRTGAETGTGTDGTVGTALKGLYGTLTLNSDGSYTYTVDNSNPTVNALKTGETLVEKFTYTVTDSGNLSDTAEFAITIQGHTDNSAPVAGDDTGTAKEAGGVNNGTPGSDATGNVLGNDTDADAGDSKTVSGIRTGEESGTGTAGTVGTELKGLYGTLTMGADGTYTYVVDNSNPTVQALNPGETLQEKFTYTVKDGSGATDTAQLTITVQGANDAPTATNDGTTAVEDSGQDVKGNVLPNDTDPDHNDTKTVTGIRTGAETGTGTDGTVGTALKGLYGTLTLNSDGSYTYTVDNSNPTVNALKTGETLVEKFTYTVTDSGNLSDTAEFAITIQGHTDNSAPVAGDDTGTAKEAGGVNNGTPGSDATGNVLGNDTDVDAGDSKTVSGIRTGEESGTGTAGTVGTALKGLYGTLTMGADGTYTYVVDNSNPTVQALNPSETLQEKFTYTVKDGSGATDTAQLTITVQGANDAPTATNDGSTAVEAGGVNNGTAGSDATGNVLTNDTDVDHNDTKTVTGIRTGEETGSGTTGTVGTALKGLYGTLTLNADGSYTYVVDNANPTVQALLPGQTLVEKFTYTVKDSGDLTDTAELAITLQGADDAPVANPDSNHVTSTGTTGTPATNATGNVIDGSSNTGDHADSDVDNARDDLTVTAVNGQAGSVGKAVNGQYGKLTLNADGTYSYDLDETNATVRALPVGGVLTETFTYTVNDGKGGTATTTLTVTIDGPSKSELVANPDTNSVSKTSDGSVSSAKGNVIANGGLGDRNDVDANGEKITVTALNGDTSKVGTAVTGQYGTLRLNPDGSYTYVLDQSNAAVQALKPGQVLADTFRYTIKDASGNTAESTLTITAGGSSSGSGDTTNVTNNYYNTANNSNVANSAATGNVPSASAGGSTSASYEAAGPYLAANGSELSVMKSAGASTAGTSALAAADPNQLLDAAPAAAGVKVATETDPNALLDAAPTAAGVKSADKVKCVPKPTVRHAVAHRAVASPFRDSSPTRSNASAAFTERLKAAKTAANPAKSVIAKVQAKRGPIKCN